MGIRTGLPDLSGRSNGQCRGHRLTGNAKDHGYSSELNNLSGAILTLSLALSLSFSRILSHFNVALGYTVVVFARKVLL